MAGPLDRVDRGALRGLVHLVLWTTIVALRCDCHAVVAAFAGFAVARSNDSKARDGGSQVAAERLGRPAGARCPRTRPSTPRTARRTGPRARRRRRSGRARTRRRATRGPAGRRPPRRRLAGSVNRPAAASRSSPSSAHFRIPGELAGAARRLESRVLRPSHELVSSERRRTGRRWRRTRRRTAAARWRRP